MVTFIRKLLDTRWPSLLWTLIIFILLTMGSGSFEKASILMSGIPHLDKYIHAFLFGFLVFLWWYYLSGQPAKINTTALLIILFVAASAYGTGMEFYQKYFTSREFELGDIYADTAGAALSALICRYIKNKPLWK
jgi:VanZ family protein